ncbi:MAG: peptidoglycan DD-metalloendopeptidase family protein [Ignavibacteriae bacterium]|nr:peptidoglycan DD-metalloendopeptidase family protein [Ignavibacteria bacterium]MBI3365374.1 peptidoglycan DD-metalloendopeptidase family protein [Ignavibacteriota bacterium]
MSPENVRERKGNPRYTVVLVPEGETKQPWTVSFSRWGLIAVVAGTFLVIVSLVVAAFVYTPIGARLPIARGDLEERYGKQIVGIQEQLRALVEEMVVLRAYNLRLRTTLGEKIQGSVPIVTHSFDTTKVDSSTNAFAENSERLVEPQMSTQTEPISVIREKQASPARLVVEFPLIVPAEGFISRGFDLQQFHYGTDFAGKVGSAVLAAADGNVVFAGWTYDDGYTLLVTHGQGFMTAYKHNEALLKTTGMAVKRGEVIALLGNTGKTSSGPHLHFEVWKDGVPQDPANYLLTIQ